MNFTIQPLLRSYLLKLPKQCFPLRHFQTFLEGSRQVLEPQIPQISDLAIKEKLKESSIEFSEGHTCFHIENCHFCNDVSQRSKNSNIFINKKTGFFVCEKCKISGTWSTLNQKLKELKDPNNAKLLPLKSECQNYDKELESWKKVVSNTYCLSNLSDQELNKVFNEFQLVSVSKHVLKNLQIRINNSQDLLYFPLISSGNNIVGYKTYDLKNVSTTIPKVDSPGCLFKGKSKSTTAVIVTNISDFMALCSQNLSHAVVCLPHGALNVPQNLLPFLEVYDKLVLWLDKKDFYATGNIAKKLNNKRCYIVPPIENLTSPKNAYLCGENINLILDSAKLSYHDNIITFNSLRDDVLASIQNQDLLAGVQWKRFSELNTFLKGHRRGELTIITGSTGVGKTTFMSEYSLDLASQGVNTLWGSFEIRNVRLAKMMLQQYAGGPLSENIQEFNKLADKFEELPLFFMTFFGQQNIQDVMEAVEHCSYTYDIAHVIIDNIQFMIEIDPHRYQLDRFWKQDCLIQSFRRFASKYNCHVSLVMHPRKGPDAEELGVNSIFGGAKAAQEADNIYILQNRIIGPSVNKKFLEISKNRYSGDLGRIPLTFDKNSLSFSTLKMKEKVNSFPESEINHTQEQFYKFLKSHQKPTGLGNLEF